MSSFVLRYGGYAALLIVVLFLLTWVVWGTSLSYRASEILGYVSIVLSLSFVFFGLRAYRAEMGGELTFGQALKMGTLIALIPSLAFGIFVILFFVFRGAEWMEYALSNMPEEQRMQFESNAEMMFSPVIQGVVMFVTVFVIGFIISLISAFVLGRR